MANDNRLGAPTEGLGQTVTFAVDNLGRPSSQLEATRQSAPRNEQRGGGFARNTAAPIQVPDTREAQGFLATVQKLGASVLNPKIEAARNQAFLSGMRQVASGQAVEEIVAEQPWYAGVFGDTPVVEGARTFDSFSRVQKEAMDIESKMGEYRQLSPEQFQGVISERLSAVMTGDAATDALITQSLMKELPGIMKAQTKEHLGWQQGQFANAARSAQQIAASRFSQVHSRYNPGARAQDLLDGGDGGTFTDENDLLEAKLNFVSSFNPVPGVPEATYQKLSTGVISDLLAQRNLSAYYTLEDAGVVDAMGPENATRLRGLADRAESRARAEMPLPLVDALARIKSLPELYDQEGISEKLSESITALNAAYQRSTGAREPLLSGNTAAEIRSQLYDNQIRAERRAEEAYNKSLDKTLDDETKKAAEQQGVNEAVGLLLTGGPTSRLKAEQKRDAWDTLRADPQRLQVARVKSIDRNVFDEDGQGSIRGAARAALDANDFNAFESLYQREYLPMVQAAGGSEHVAKQYFGMRNDEFAEVYSRYHALRKSTNDINVAGAAYVMARQDPKPLSTTKGSLDVEGVAATVKATEGILFGIGKTVDERFAQDLWRELKPLVEGRSGKTEDNVKAALKTRQQSGLEYAAGYFWVGDEANAFSNAVNRLGTGNDRVHPDEFSDAFGRAVEASIAKHGLSPDSVKPVFWRNQDKSAAIQLFGQSADGQWRIIPLTPQEVHDTELAYRKRPQLPIPGVNLPAFQAGKKTFQVKEGAKSIYSY